MLFDHHLFPAIMRGEITLTFRAWSRPQAKAGARHRLNPHGVIEIASVDRVAAGAITSAELRRAGFENRKELMEAVRRRKHDPAPQYLYRVEFRFVPDGEPLSELAHDATLSKDDIAALTRKLDRMDASSAHGPWTRSVLRLIERNPRVLSTTLAAKLGRERPAFKTDVRKLKALGLTISHEVGYEISPRGHAFLAREDAKR